MMSDDELQDLAVDIEANGLIHPIIIDEDEQIIDGRNRLAACKIAKVKPTFEKLNGQNPLAYIVSANLNRRNLTKGQQAMAFAFIYPEGEKGGRGKKSERVVETTTLSRSRITQARYVLRHSPKLAEAVLKGTTKLDDALSIVREEERRSNSAETKLIELRQSAPDLADRVEDEGDKLNIDDALSILSGRIQKLQEIVESGKTSIDGLGQVDTWVISIQMALGAARELRPMVKGKSSTKPLLTAKLVDELTDSIKRLRDLLKEQKDE
jgi:hypothetical protein